jgi:hypothetical protein
MIMSIKQQNSQFSVARRKVDVIATIDYWQEC